MCGIYSYVKNLPQTGSASLETLIVKIGHWICALKSLAEVRRRGVGICRIGNEQSFHKSVSVGDKDGGKCLRLAGLLSEQRGIDP